MVSLAEKVKELAASDAVKYVPAAFAAIVAVIVCRDWNVARRAAHLPNKTPTSR
jgi:hypothetical protein